MVWNSIDSNKHEWGIQRFSHLDKATKYEYLTNVTNMTLKGRFYDTNIDVDHLHHAFHPYTKSTPVSTLYDHSHQ